MIPRAAAAFAVLALTGSSPALAGPGNGIRIGGSEGRLHPWLELETRWDSNAQFEAGSAEPALALHVRPGFTLSSPSDRLDIQAEGNLDWQQYVSGQDTEELNRLFAEASLGVGVNRRGTIGLELSEHFRRSTTTNSLTFASAVISNTNTLDLSIPYRPGGGALTVTALGTWLLESFEPYSDCLPGLPNASCSEDELNALGYDELRGGLELKWRFLPRTALVLDGSYTQRYPNDETLSPQVSGWRAEAGLQGLVTPHLAATLKGGWGSADGADTLSTWLANAELEWLPSITTSARVGWLHDWGGDPGTSFSLYATHRIYATVRVLLAGRWTASLRGQLEMLDYAANAGTNQIVEVEPHVDYALARWATAGVGYKYSKRDANVVNQPPGYAYDFTKNELWLRFRATY